MPYRTVNQALMSYREQGTGMPLVLVHGFPLDGRIFEQQISSLASRFRVIVPDLKGFGQSKSDRPFTIASAADDLHELLTSMNALPCALGGLSMGGYVSLAFAKKYPTDLTHLILIDTRSEGDSAEAKANRDRMIQAVRAGGSKAIADQMLPKMFAQSTIDSKPETVRQLQQIMEQCPPKTIENALVALRDREDYSSTLPSIAVPTLIIVGDEDAITPPSMAQKLHESVPNSKLVRIPGAGHVSTMERPDEVTGAIVQFLAS